MRKLQLDIDVLTVESFAPQDQAAAEGTVVAHATEAGPCGGDSECMTCADWPTCDGAYTCDGATICYTNDYRDTCYGSCASCTVATDA